MVMQHLLQHGYVVKAIVHGTSNPKKSEHLFALDGAKERIQLVQTDLLEEGDFDSAVDGGVGVFYTAFVIMESSNPPIWLLLHYTAAAQFTSRWFIIGVGTRSFWIWPNDMVLQFKLICRFISVEATLVTLLQISASITLLEKFLHHSSNFQKQISCTLLETSSLDLCLSGFLKETRMWC